MKTIMITAAIMTILGVVAAFFNPSHVWTAWFCGCVTLASYLEVKSEEEKKA